MKNRIVMLSILVAAVLLITAACGPAAAPTQAPAAQPTAAEQPTAAAQPTAVEQPTAAAQPTVAAQPTAAEQPTEAAAEATPTEVIVVATAAAPIAGKVPVRWYVGLGTGQDPAQVEVQQKVVEEFNASHPDIQLILEVVAYNPSRDILATQIAAGNPPDIVGPIGVSGAEAFHGQWLDLAPLITKNNYDLSQYDQGAVDFYKVGGEGQVGIPFGIFPSVLFYQREMFDEVGLAYPPHKVGEKYKWPDGTEEEWNYDTLRKLAMILTVDKNGKDATQEGFDPTNIVQYGYEPQYQDLRAVGSYFGAGSFVAPDGKTAQIPPEWVDAWKWLYDGIWKDHFVANDAVRNSQEYGAGNVFNSGKAAMALTHLWYTCCLTDAGGKWDVAVVPSHNGKITSNFNADTFRIMQDTKHPDEAFTVLSYLLNDASDQLLDAYDALPAQKGAQADFFTIRDEQFPQKVDWPVFLDMIAYADNPSFEGFMPNYNESFDLAATFLSKLYTSEGLNLDDEISKFKTDLQATFDK